MSGPALAIVVVCFNYEEYVGLAIASVQSQHRSDCELIVVDDGSTDGSWDVIESTGATAYRIPNGGPRGACLFGVQRTTAPFILFLDADDELKPGALDVIVPQLTPTVSKLQFPLTRVNARGEVIGSVCALSGFRERRRLQEQVLATGVYASPPTSGNVFRRDVCELLLPEAVYDKYVDGVILFAAPFMGDIVGVSTHLGLYRVHNRNASGVGSVLDPLTIKRDLDQFEARHEHLRQFLRVLGETRSLVAANDTFFYWSRTISLDVASGRRPSVASILRSFRGLRRERMRIGQKVAMVLLYSLMLMPNSLARPLLEYRYQAGRRTFVGLMSCLWRKSQSNSASAANAHQRRSPPAIRNDKAISID